MHHTSSARRAGPGPVGDVQEATCSCFPRSWGERAQVALKGAGSPRTNGSSDRSAGNVSTPFVTSVAAEKFQVHQVSKEEWQGLTSNVAELTEKVSLLLRHLDGPGSFGARARGFALESASVQPVSASSSSKAPKVSVWKDADRPAEQITDFDGRSGLPPEVLQQPTLLVNHMKERQDRPDILMQCCIWLQLQVAIGARESAGGAGALLVEAGAIEAVVDCMLRHSDKAKVQETALWALWTLAAQERYVKRVASSGATESIITAMRTHPYEPGVQEQALWCLYWLTAKHCANKSEVVSLGGSNLVAMAASNHPTVKNITGFVPIIQVLLSDALAVPAGHGSAATPAAASKSLYSKSAHANRPSQEMGCGEAYSDDDSEPRTDGVDWSLRRGSLASSERNSTLQNDGVDWSLRRSSLSDPASSAREVNSAGAAVVEYAAHTPAPAAAAEQGQEVRNDDNEQLVEKQQLVGRKLYVHVIKAEHLPKMDFTGAADPYVKMTLGEHQRVSKTVKNTVSPVWDEHFEFQLDAACDELLFTLMDWDRFKANEVIGECRVALRDLGSLLGKPCTLQVLQPTKGKPNVIGKDHCSATLSVALSLSERKDFKLEEVPPQPANMQLSISSTEGGAAEYAQRTQMAASLTEDKPFSEGVESGNGIEATWSRLEQLNHKLGSSTDRSHARWSVSSPRNVFDSILCSLDSPRGEDYRALSSPRAKERMFSNSASDLRPVVLGASPASEKSYSTQRGQHSVVQCPTSGESMLTSADVVLGSGSDSQDHEHGGLNDGASLGFSREAVSSQPIIITSRRSHLVSSPYEYY